MGHYDDSIIAFLGALWGEGYMSPGGSDEVARVVNGLDLRGLTILDIGSGAGGATIDLARHHGAGRVIGIDPEADACAAARRLAERAGVSDRVEIQLIEPGPLPFDDQSFDIVFSKDSIIHIPDKEWLSAEVFRVLKPGGWFAASDWMISHDDAPSPEMAHYIKCEDLDFAMSSPVRYNAALTSIGFEHVHRTNRNAWYADLAEEELNRLTGPGRSDFDRILGSAAVDEQIETWKAMVVVLRSGEHCPHHLRAQRPI
ncbi:MAG: methyltransferase domain-containing protein [Pseudomonadota bacterium]